MARVKWLLCEMSSESNILRVCSATQPPSQWRLIVSVWLSFIFSLFFPLFFSLQYHLEHKQSVRSHQSRRAWHPHRIGSFHRRKKRQFMIHYQCFIPPPSPPLPSLPPSDFTAAHQILTQSFFDAGVSQDSRKVWVRRAWRPKCEQGPRWKRKNSSSSFVLLDVKSW